MKLIIVILIIIGFFGFFTFSILKSNSSNRNYAAENLNLKAVSALAAECATPEEFEKKLNDPKNNYVNLDLDNDNKVDFVKVDLIDQKTKGYSLTVAVNHNGKKEIQEIATIQFEENGENSVMIESHGNEQIYGSNHYHHRPYSLTNMLIWHYMWNSNRSRYYSRNNHSSYGYNTKTPQSSQAYSSLHNKKDASYGYTSTTRSTTKTPVNSPNKNKVATNIKSPLKKPTASQSGFQSKYGAAKSIRFGSSTSSRSGSSFGGGK